MKNLNWWSMAGVAAMSMALTACGSSSDSAGNSSVRIANATLTHASLDLLVGGSVSSSATLKDTVGAYVAPASGVTTLQINDAGSATALATTTPSLSGNLHYTLLAYESGGVVKTVVLNEDYATPAANAAQIRIYDAVPEAGKLDYYITDNAVTSLAGLSATGSFTTGVAASTALITEAVGSYKVWITGYGAQSDIRIVVPAVTVASQQIATVVLTPAAGGVLLNGSTLIQQGAYTAARNTNARVRLAAGVSGSATIAASAGGSTIEAGHAVPWFGYYALVPAASAINISVNGNSVGAPTGALAAGSDYTLFVYGSSTSSTATLLADDNRTPTDATATKLRLLNGVTGSTGTLTLTANNTLVANAVAPGMASSYASVTGSTTAQNLTLTSSLVSGPLYIDTTDIFNAGTVFTIMAAGPVSAPFFLIR